MPCSNPWRAYFALAELGLGLKVHTVLNEFGGFTTCVTACQRGNFSLSLETVNPRQNFTVSVQELVRGLRPLTNNKNIKERDERKTTEKRMCEEDLFGESCTLTLGKGVEGVYFHFKPG